MAAHPYTRDQLVPHGLPKGADVVAEGRSLGRKITVGRTLFVEAHGVSSESEYKRRMREQGRMMFHAQYGLSNWPDSAEGLKLIYHEATARGARIDRFGICLDRAMGLPPEQRDCVPRETGLKLSDRSEWLQIGRVVPIQPHMGDHMLGSPASVQNVTYAMEAGITYVGNLSQFFLFEYPSWKDQTTRSIETLKALAIMAELRDRGAVLSSNLDDGPGSMFNDRVSVAGWAMVEKYIAEDLLGVDVSHCFGNLVTDPRLRQATLFMIDAIHGGITNGSMVVGNTMYTLDDDRNVAILASYLTFDMAAQMHRPTGHALYVTPVTEHRRIPSPEEIVQVQVMASQLEREMRKALPLFSVRESEELAATLLERGAEFRDNVLRGLAAMGVDVRDPLELLVSLKTLGGRRI
ncbi:MAG: hypothetical protein HY678_07590, partial [Chloroflexi bacterium]|nr:hypothetical protein [Chloroflexota bacterium]